MRHIYSVHGMSCKNCRVHVEEALKKTVGVTGVTVDLLRAEAVIDMESHIPLERFQEALVREGGNYSISLPGDKGPVQSEHEHGAKPADSGKGSGVYYCPMHCEGDKTYDKPGNCPVCGMDLVEQPSAEKKLQYTCPMHPEIMADEPGVLPNLRNGSGTDGSGCGRGRQNL